MKKFFNFESTECFYKAVITISCSEAISRGDLHAVICNMQRCENKITTDFVLTQNHTKHHSIFCSANQWFLN